MSRLAYQKGYALRNSDAPKVDAEFSTAKGAQPRSYAKSGSKPDAEINVSYGDDLVPELPKTAPQSKVKNTIVKAKQLK